MGSDPGATGDPGVPDDPEATLLGALMCFPDLLPTAAALVSSNDFGRPAHQRLYNLLTLLHGRGVTNESDEPASGCSTAALLDYLFKRPLEEHESLGGIHYVVGLPLRARIPEAVEPLARRVRQDAIRRQVQDIARRMLTAIEAGDRTGDVVKEAQRGLVGVGWRLSGS